MKKPPRFYFSFRSPFSWIAAQIIDERLTEEERKRIEFIPFWEPDELTNQVLQRRGGSFHYRQMTREKHLYILQDVKRLTSSLGYTHVWPIDDDPWWDLPNLAYIAARRAGLAEPFRKAVYRARWEEGRNIHEMDTVLDIAKAVGLSEKEAAAASEDPSVRDEAAQALLRAHQESVFGVPFFIVGFNKYWGVDRLAPFLSSLQGQDHKFRIEAPLWEELHPSTINTLGVHEEDTAGGCG